MVVEFRRGRKREKGVAKSKNSPAAPVTYHRMVVGLGNLEFAEVGTVRGTRGRTAVKP